LSKPGTGSALSTGAARIRPSASPSGTCSTSPSGAARPSTSRRASSISISSLVLIITGRGLA
jgi:hypothetical protein